jgi:ABC-2 type transport system ATP-binding protein
MPLLRLAGGLTALLALVFAAPAQARDATVTSFDGTPIVTSFFPADGLAAGKRAPTILMTHGWGGSRDATGDGQTSESTGTVGTAALRKAGFNVLTWDSRGFGESGGTVTVDYQGNEGRDVQALIDYVAKQPEAQLDAAGDPRVGMHGGSYAGGIEFVAAAIDKRIDVIAPDIAWHSLLTSLYKEETVKGGWSAALYAGGQSGNLDPHITSAFAQGASTGKLSPDDRAWFDSRGPSTLVNNIKIPTFVIQGTADTLFTLHEAITNYGILRANGVPTKMLWFCGGHGTCLTGTGEAGHFERAVIAWMKRYLVGNASVDTGPRFEWLADDAKWRSAGDFPTPASAPIVAEGSGTLAVNPGDAASGTPIAAGPATNAVSVTVPPPGGAAQVAGEPSLSLTYSGTGTATHVFAQLVDTVRGVVVGNQVTPIPVTLDGSSHTVKRSLEGIAASLSPSSRLVLQVIGGSQVYGPVRSAAAVQIAKARLEIPTVGAAGGGAGGGVLPGSRRCTSRRSFVIRLHEPKRGKLKLKGTRVTVAGKRVKVFRRKGRIRARVNLSGRPGQKVRVKVVTHTTRGKVLRDTRVYRTCVPTKKKKKKKKG